MYAIPQTYSVDFAMNNLHVQFDNLFNGNKVLGEILPNEHNIAYISLQLHTKIHLHMIPVQKRKTLQDNTGNETI
jgi:hypothetical protein